jgi:hypothetical protein
LAFCACPDVVLQLPNTVKQRGFLVVTCPSLNLELLIAICLCNHHIHLLLQSK